MGRIDVWSETMRLGQLPKEERKAISKVVSIKGNSFDHTSVCTREIWDMVACFESNSWDTLKCMPQINEMQGCVELHKRDPVRAPATPPRARPLERSRAHVGRPAPPRPPP